MLTVYNGTSISYDEIGNPSNWHNALSMSWDKRELTSLVLNDNGTLSFSYNSSGLRTQKVYTNGDTVTVHDYILDGTSIISETVTENGVAEYTLYYFYDETGVAGFEYNGVKYHYIKNLQGDIVSIYNNNGAVVVNYTYDAWGNVLSVTGSLADTIGHINPFRYRSYYYDTETGFYYLQSRYYDPSVGRFLNADGIVGANGGVVGYNMFAYCNNNPIGFCDPSGCSYINNPCSKPLITYYLSDIMMSVHRFACQKIQLLTIEMLCRYEIPLNDARHLAHLIVSTRLSGNRGTLLVAYDSASPDMGEYGDGDKIPIDYSGKLFIVEGYSISNTFNITTLPQFAASKMYNDELCVAILANGKYKFSYLKYGENKFGYHIKTCGNNGRVPAFRWSPSQGKFVQSTATGILIHMGWNRSNFNNPASLGCILIKKEQWYEFQNSLGMISGTLIIYGPNRHG